MERGREQREEGKDKRGENEEEAPGYFGKNFFSP